MKKHLPVFGFIFLSFFNLYPQSSHLLSGLKTFPVRTIQSSDENFEDLQFLKDVLKDKRIVLLGEQTHGDGATFEAKVRIIKFLHQQMGFSVLSFESGMYENYKAWQQLKPDDAKNSPLKKSILSIWSDTREVQSLIDYVHKQRNSVNPLMPAGFDSYEDSYFRENYIQDLQSAVKISREDIAVLEQLMDGGIELVTGSEKDSLEFYTARKRISESLANTVKSDKSERLQIIQQTFISWMAMLDWEINTANGRETIIQNPRDEQMARNMIFLSQLYPAKKIIGWGATYHFANKTETIEISELTKKYVHIMDSLEKNPEPTDLHENIDGAITMGKILKEHFGNSLYSVSFSSFEGTYAMVGRELHSLTAIQPPPQSIEAQLINRGMQTAFVDYSTAIKFYSSAIANIPLSAPWKNVVDGLFFTKTSYPPSFPDVVLSDADRTKEKSATAPAYTVTNSKKIVNSQTGEGVSFAAISLDGTSKGVATNSAGEFVFNSPKAKPEDKVIISSMGYETITVTLAELNKRSVIQLNPKAFELDAVEVKAKNLTAKEIIRKAEKSIKKNYFLGANSQEIFFRSSAYLEDSLSFNEEASIHIYDPVGFKPTGNASKVLKGEILQFRNTTDNPQKDLWAGVGGVWLVYSHDLIRSKSNVLHRSGFYNAKLEGVTMFDNRRVFEISFDCKRPGAFTTGFGYSAPKSATGKIFIDIENFAVLKFEALIVRKPYANKRHPEVKWDPYGYQILQTYKQVDGKYFMNYSRQVMYNRTVNTKLNKSARAAAIRELIATDLKTGSTSIPTLSIHKIKSVKVPTNPDFWKLHNTIIEDDVMRIYREIGL